MTQKYSASTKLSIAKKDNAENFLPLLIISSFMLFLKLFMSYHVYGTNDITYWMQFADILQKHGTFKIYSLVKIYNHPPLMSWILNIISLVCKKTGLVSPFPFIFRFMPVLADYASVFIVWQLLKKYNVRHRLIICSICSINPINFFVSGFHGNTDPVFILLVLAAIYFSENSREMISGLVYGLSMCIKIVPILLLPAFLFYINGIRKRIIFLTSCLVIPIVVFMPYLINEYNAMVKNIFNYSSLKGIWGIGHVCLSIISNEGLSTEIRRFFYNVGIFHMTYGIAVFLAIVIVLLKLFTDKKVLNLTESVFFIFCMFLTITPGFGVQYLSWLSIFAVMVMPILGTLYFCVGGLFLFRVYYYWCGGAAPYYANSDLVGQWVGFEKILDLMVWVVVVVMLVKFIYQKMKLL